MTSRHRTKGANTDAAVGRTQKDREAKKTKSRSLRYGKTRKLSLSLSFPFSFFSPPLQSQKHSEAVSKSASKLFMTVRVLK